MQVNEETGFVPTIVAFCCNWCSYAGADLSGTNRLSYPANIKIIRVLLDVAGKLLQGGIVVRLFHQPVNFLQSSRILNTGAGDYQKREAYTCQQKAPLFFTEHHCNSL